MRYLIQNRKEFAITVAAFIMAVINLGKAIRTGEIDADLIVAVLVTGTTILAWYYNMPTSEENAEYTGLMRLMKEQNAGVITGEDFLEDGAPIEDNAPDVETDDDAPDEDGEDFEDDDEDGGEQ